MSAGALYSSCPFTSKEQIRILRLAPAIDFDEDLRGELEIRSFKRLPPYEALSYTWQPPFEGQILPDSVIWFFGYLLPITGNLSDALRRIRRKDKERVLWVDAVCIDQENPLERNHQAGLMAEIYSKAFKVLAWLGEDSTLCDGTYTLASLASSDVDTFALLDVKESLRERYEASERQRDERTLFHTFTRRRFFRRRWVLQELILARSVEMICGSYAIPWNIFVAALSERCRPGRNAVALAHPLRPLLDLVRSIWTYQAGSSYTFLETMHQFEDTLCEDDRDRICALTHIRKFPELQKFHADYSLSREKFYSTFAISVHHASPTHFAELVHLAALQHQWRHLHLPLPSWVPDWRLGVAATIAECLAEYPFRSNNSLPTHNLAVIQDRWTDECWYTIDSNTTFLARIPLYNVKEDHPDVKLFSTPDWKGEYSRQVIVGPRFCVLSPGNNSKSTFGLELALVLNELKSEPGRYRITGVCSFRRSRCAVETGTEFVNVAIV